MSLATILLTSVVVLPLAGAALGRLRRGGPAEVRWPLAGVAAGGAIALLSAVAWWGERPGAVPTWGPLLAAFAAVLGIVVMQVARRSLVGEPQGARYFPAAAAVVGAVAAGALAPRWWMVAVAWVGLSRVVPLLIAHDGRGRAAASARLADRTALAGDAAIIAAAVAIEAGIPVSNLLVGLALVVAVAARCGLPPFHRWVHATVDTPTPVSALLHAGVVNGGAVLLLRAGGDLHVAAAFAAVVVGAGAIVAGMAVAPLRPDVKGALAWSTTAQMGLMVVELGVGLTSVAVVHLVAHGLYKAHRFLSAGEVPHLATASHASPASPASLGSWALALVGSGAAVLGVVALLDPGLLDRPAAVLPLVLWTALLARASVTAVGAAGRRGAPAALAAAGAVAVVAGLAHAIEPIAPSRAPGTWATAASLSVVAVMAVVALLPRSPAPLARRAWATALATSHHATWRSA